VVLAEDETTSTCCRGCAPPGSLPGSGSRSGRQAATDAGTFSAPSTGHRPVPRPGHPQGGQRHFRGVLAADPGRLPGRAAGCGGLRQRRHPPLQARPAPAGRPSPAGRVARGALQPHDNPVERIWGRAEGVAGELPDLDDPGSHPPGPTATSAPAAPSRCWRRPHRTARRGCQKVTCRPSGRLLSPWTSMHAPAGWRVLVTSSRSAKRVRDRTAPSDTICCVADGAPMGWAPGSRWAANRRRKDRHDRCRTVTDHGSARVLPPALTCGFSLILHGLLTVRHTHRAGRVGSDTEEVTGSNPVAPTT
jgi:hypothetical protein